jgi:hypothetical protein
MAILDKMGLWTGWTLWTVNCSLVLNHVHHVPNVHPVHHVDLVILTRKSYRLTTNSVNEPATIGGRGRGSSVVGAGA